MKLLVWQNIFELTFLFLNRKFFMSTAAVTPGHIYDSATKWKLGYFNLPVIQSILIKQRTLQHKRLADTAKAI